MEVETPFSEPNITGRPANKMSFMDATKTVIQKSFTLQGRASRSEYWFFYLFIIIAEIGLIIIDGVLGTPLILLIATMIPAIFCVTMRRFHDIGKSGWWLLVVFIPLIGGLVFLYWFIFDGGQPHANDYGAVPTNTLE
tara:strand:- start:128 stop:541 length:414 start_codon:yes stop_codon:yes gene_type:complete